MPSTGRVHVRPFEPADFERAAEVLANAFAEEALFSSLLRADKATRARRLQPLMRGMLAGHLPCSAVDVAIADGQLAGVAIAIRPDRFPISGRDMAFIAIRTLPAALVLAASSPGILRLFVAAAALEKNHPRDSPCYYLAFFGVDPALRRGGTARALARAVVERADGQDVGCYLDTAGTKTMRMCRFLGFQVRHTMQPLPSGPTVFGMWRGPRTPTPGSLRGGS